MTRPTPKNKPASLKDATESKSRAKESARPTAVSKAVAKSSPKAAAKDEPKARIAKPKEAAAKSARTEAKAAAPSKAPAEKPVASPKKASGKAPAASLAAPLAPSKIRPARGTKPAEALFEEPEEPKKNDRGEKPNRKVVKPVQEAVADLFKSELPEVEAQVADTLAEPQAHVTFESLVQDERLLEAIASLGWKLPTTVQAQALPFTLNGKDVCAFAQTGTGKTAVIALTSGVRLLAPEAIRLKPKSPSVLILVPTRELAEQVEKDISGLLGGLGIKSIAIYGGTDMDKQTQALAQGIDVVVATPGRMLDHYKHKNLDFDAISFFVCDECDRMFDMGFIEDVEFVLKRLPEERVQKLMTSATGSEKVRELAFEYLENPEYIESNPEKITAENITQVAYAVPAVEKFQVLMGHIKTAQPKCAIIFTNTKVVAEWVGYKLACNGIEAEVLTGDLPQNKRMRLIERIKEGNLHVLVATDVLSRGLHVVGLTHVYNFDVPEEPESFVHRVGRTARAGAEGTAVSLVCEDYGFNMGAVERLLGFEVPVQPIPAEFLKMEDKSDFPFDDQGRVKLVSQAGQAGATSAEREDSQDRRPERTQRPERSYQRPERGPRPEHSDPLGAEAQASRPERTARPERNAEVQMGRGDRPERGPRPDAQRGAEVDAARSDQAERPRRDKLTAVAGVHGVETSVEAEATIPASDRGPRTERAAEQARGDVRRDGRPQGERPRTEERGDFRRDERPQGERRPDARSDVPRSDVPRSEAPRSDRLQGEGRADFRRDERPQVPRDARPDLRGPPPASGSASRPGAAGRPDFRRDDRGDRPRGDERARETVEEALAAARAAADARRRSLQPARDSNPAESILLNAGERLGAAVGFVQSRLSETIDRNVPIIGSLVARFKAGLRRGGEKPKT